MKWRERWLLVGSRLRRLALKAPDHRDRGRHPDHSRRKVRKIMPADGECDCDHAEIQHNRDRIKKTFLPKDPREQHREDDVEAWNRHQALTGKQGRESSFAQGREIGKESGFRRRRRGPVCR